MLSLSKRLSQNHWPLFLLSNISSIVNMLLPIILVRLFAPIQMGIYKTFFLYLSLIPFIVMAGGPLNSVYYWMGKGEDQNDFIKSTWFVTLILSALILIPGTIGILLFKDQLALSTPVLFMLLVSGFLICPSGHYNEVCIARGHRFLGAGLGVSFEVIKTIGFIFIAWKTRNVDYLFTYFFIMMCLSFIFMTFLGYKNDAVTLVWDTKKIKEILRYSMPISVSSCLLFVTEKADLLIISAIVASESFAYYSLGCLIIPPLYLLENAVQKNLIPKLSIHFQMNRLEEMKEDFKKAVSDIAYLVIPAVFGLIIFAHPIINLLYTSEYEASAHYLKIFALSYLLLLIPHDSILRATAKTDLILKIYFYLTPISIVLIYLSAKFMSLQWVLITGLILKLVPKIYCLRTSSKIIKAKIFDLIPFRNLAHYTLASLLLGVISLALKMVFPSELKWLLTCAPLFALCYISYFVFFQSKHIELSK